MPIRPFLFTLLVAAPAAAAPVLQIDSAGKLTGASGVEVLGTLYDVEFVDGSCLALFDGCMPSAFAFTTEQSARAASQSLLDQVFLDGPQLSLDSQPNVNGCEDTFICATATPYEEDVASDVGRRVVAALAINSRLESADSAIPRLSANFGYDLTDTATYSWARWSLQAEPPAAVPEPASLPLALAALAATAALSVRRRRARHPGKAASPTATGADNAWPAP